MTKALAAGKLFEELGVDVDCYVLEGPRRVLSQRGILRAIRGKNDGRERGDLGVYLSRLPSRYAELATATEIEFTLPGGGIAIGREAQWFVVLLARRVPGVLPFRA